MRRFRELLPGREIVFAECGTQNVNGAIIDWGSRVLADPCERDDQEFSDTWRAFFDAMVALDLDGASLWNYDYYGYTFFATQGNACRSYINGTWAERVVADFLRLSND